MGNAYRSAYEHIIETRLAETAHARDAIEPLVPELRTVRAARVARIASGTIGIAGAVATAVLACMEDCGPATTYALLGATAGAFGVYVLLRVTLSVVGPWWRFFAPTGTPPLTGELDRDLDILAGIDPVSAVKRRLAPLEAWSTTLPLVALSLLMPLSLHAIVAAMTGEVTFATGFATWIRISLVIVGHAHLALAAMSVAFGRKLYRSSDEALGQMKIHTEWSKAWGLTVLVSCMPGVALMLVPPAITAITGLLFIPFMFIAVHRAVRSERAVIARAAACRA